MLVHQRTIIRLCFPIFITVMNHGIWYCYVYTWNAKDKYCLFYVVIHVISIIVL